MEFRVLGPLEIFDGDREVVVKGPKQRLLLGVLLLHANEVVSSDRLIEALWGERVPDTAPKSLQMHVSGLRKALEPGRSPGGAGEILRTRPPGYELRLAPSQLDLHRFEHAVGEAKAAATAGKTREAAGMLRDALQLWRGPPLADLSFEAYMQIEIVRLEESHLAALEERIDADLALGRHGELIGEIESLASRYPLRERIRGQFMLALYRSGRQAEALDVYRDTRRTLVEELGIEPGRELKDLERRVLAQDPGLDASDALKAEPTLTDVPAAETLVGREPEMARLRPAVDAALSGRSGLILIGGEPGIGKSRLAEALAAHAHERGGRVIVGRCWEAGGAPAYWPWVQALRSYVRDTDAEALRAQLGRGAGDLVAILPELGDLLDDLPEKRAPDSEGARFQVFEAAAVFLRNAASSEPLAVFLDDLHAADVPSLLLLRFVAAELAGAPLLIVGCYRDTEIGPALAEALGELARGPATERVALTGLGGADTSRLLELALGHAPTDELAVRVQAETAGNPLFAAEIARLLASEHERVLERDGLPIPNGVSETIGRRLARQPEGCREVLTLASIIGREFNPAILQKVSGLVEDELFNTLDELAAARLVGGVPGTSGRLRFSHILVRDALYNDLSAPQRLRLHRLVGEALEEFYAGNHEPYLAELAYHFLNAGSLAPEKAVEYAERAGHRAASQYAYEEAARQFTTALEVLELVGTADLERICDLLLARGDALSRAGDLLESKAALRRGAAIAEQAGWSDRLARAALGYGGRFGWARAGTDPAFVPLLERALDAVGEEDSTARARLLARLAAALRDEPRRDHRVALAHEAVDIATRIGDPATLVDVLEGYWVAVEGPDSAQEAVAVSNRIIALGEEIGNPERVFAGHDHRLNAAWVLADRAGVDVELDHLRGLVDDLRQPAQRWHVSTTQAVLALMEGRFAEAEPLIDQTLALGSGAVSWNARVSHRIQLFILRRAQGRLDEIQDAIARSVHEFPALLRFQCALAHVHAQLGREQDAHAIFGDLLCHDLGAEYVDAEWLFSMSLLPDVCAYLNDQGAADRLYALLHPYARLYAHAPVEAAFGSVARALGVLATTLGQFDEAEEHFEAAIDTERRMRARPWLAHAQHDLAAMLFGRGNTGDLERAGGLRDEARGSFSALGVDAWATRAAELGQAR
jgi:DNA-binding SARP family transcriptional activator/tetratricopeptide (TPR) repeat protein